MARHHRRRQVGPCAAAALRWDVPHVLGCVLCVVCGLISQLTAVANTGVPKLTVVVGTSYGLGNYGMGGRVNSPRLLFMWPTAKIGAMDPTQAADVVTMLESRDRVPDGRDTEAWQAAHQKFEEQSSALYSTARLWDDGVIRPSETRDVLKAALSAALGSPGHGGRFGVFRM